MEDDNSIRSHTPPDTASARRASDEFGNVPNAAEGVGNVPHSSEPVRTVPDAAEAFRNLRHPAERDESHTLTVREVARLFEAAGVARTERSIVNWCQPNRTGVARLDAYFDPNERKYYLTRESVDLAIAEERAKAAKTSASPGTTSDFRSVPNDPPASATQPDRDTGTTADDTELRREVLDLKIANRAKDMFIEQLKQEREGFAAERRDYVDKLMTFNHRVGKLETRLLQLGAGKSDEPPDVAAAT